MSESRDLFARVPFLFRFVKWRGFQLALVLPNLFLFAIFIFAGFFGTPVGNRNIVIVFVWVLWWFLLIALLVPFLGRVWCTLCPLPFWGDWLQRRALFGVRPGRTHGLHNEMFGRNARWPKRLSNIWLQSVGSLLLATFAAMLVTRPLFSAIVLLALTLLAALVAFLYRQRAFCQYLCPIGGFLSLYAMSGKIALSARDRTVCLRCLSKDCVAGNEQGWACPWFLYMGELDRNNYCGLCMECVKSCPHDNIALYERPFASDHTLKRFDEAWRAFMMVTMVFVYALVFLGPWGWLKNVANVTESKQWLGFLGYAGVVWLGSLAAVPALFYGVVWCSRWLARSSVSNRVMFLQYAAALVPLGLLAWVAFSLPLLTVNGAYLVAVISDPFGWGWDLFGTAHFPWSPFLPEYVPYLQFGSLLIGLVVSLSTALRNTEPFYPRLSMRVLAIGPIALWLIAISCLFAWVFLG